MVGNNTNATVSECFATGSVKGDASLGGLVGVNSRGTISHCYATGQVEGDGDVGGLVGINSWESTVLQSFATGPVTGAICSGGCRVVPVDIGGLVGDNKGAISRCYAGGSVTGNALVGGLVGRNPGQLSECYSTGVVSGGPDDDRVGGLVGANEYGPLHGNMYYGEIVSSFWDSRTSQRSNMCGRLGGSGCDDTAGKTTGEMKEIDTFIEAGWDFVGERVNGTDDIWKMTCEGMSYPNPA